MSQAEHTLRGAKRNVLEGIRSFLLDFVKVSKPLGCGTTLAFSVYPDERRSAGVRDDNWFIGLPVIGVSVLDALNFQ